MRWAVLIENVSTSFPNRDEVTLLYWYDLMEGMQNCATTFSTGVCSAESFDITVARSSHGYAKRRGTSILHYWPSIISKSAQRQRPYTSFSPLPCTRQITFGDCHKNAQDDMKVERWDRTIRIVCSSSSSPARTHR